MRYGIEVLIRELIYAPARVHHAWGKDRAAHRLLQAQKRPFAQAHQIFEEVTALRYTALVEAHDDDMLGLDYELEAARTGQPVGMLCCVLFCAQIYGLPPWRSAFCEQHRCFHAGKQIVLQILRDADEVLGGVSGQAYLPVVCDGRLGRQAATTLVAPPRPMDPIEPTTKLIVALRRELGRLGRRFDFSLRHDSPPMPMVLHMRRQVRHARRAGMSHARQVCHTRQAVDDSSLRGAGAPARRGDLPTPHPIRTLPHVFGAAYRHGYLRTGPGYAGGAVVAAA